MKPEKNYLVTQSNKLVEARYSLTIYEQRILLMMISLIEENDKDFKNYKIKISDFIDLVGLKGGSAYTRIKSILRDFRKREVLIERENSKSFLVTGWISSAEYIDEKGEIKLAFDPNLKPYLLNVKREFLKLRLHTVISFKSSYTTRIYTLLKQHQKFGKRSFSIDGLKEILGLGDDKYPVYADFKKNVIILSQKELNKKNEDGKYISDIGFEFEQIKTGRKITGIRFLIINHRVEGDLLDSSNPSTACLLSYGVSSEKSTELAMTHSEEEIQRCVLIYEKKRKANKVNDGVGLLIHLIETGAGQKTEKEAEEEKKVKAKEEEERRGKSEALRAKLSKRFQAEKVAGFLSSLTEEENSALVETVLKAYKGKKFETELIKGSGLSDPIIRMEVVKHIPNYEEEKEEYINSKL